MFVKRGYELGCMSLGLWSMRTRWVCGTDSMSVGNGPLDNDCKER